MLGVPRTRANDKARPEVGVALEARSQAGIGIGLQRMLGGGVQRRQVQVVVLDCLAVLFQGLVPRQNKGLHAPVKMLWRQLTQICAQLDLNKSTTWAGKDMHRKCSSATASTAQKVDQGAGHESIARPR